MEYGICCIVCRGYLLYNMSHFTPCAIAFSYREYSELSFETNPKVSVMALSQMYLLQVKADSREMRLWSEREIISSRSASRSGCRRLGIFLYKRLPRTRIIGQEPETNISRTALSNSLWNVLITGSEPLACSTAQSRHGNITLLFVHREQRKPCLS